MPPLFSIILDNWHISRIILEVRERGRSPLIYKIPTLQLWYLLMIPITGINVVTKIFPRNYVVNNEDNCNFEPYSDLSIIMSTKKKVFDKIF